MRDSFSNPTTNIFRLVRSAVFLCGFHLLLGALFIVAFSSQHQWGGWKYRLLFVAFHAAIHLPLWFVLFAVCGVALQVRNGWIRNLVMLIPSAAFVLLLLLWLADWVTTFHWGINVSDELVWEVLRHWQSYADLLPQTVLLGLAVGVMLVFALYHWLARRAIADFGALVLRLRAIRLRWLIPSAIIVVAGYAVLFVLLWHPWMLQWNFWQREPLVGLVVLQRIQLIFPEHAQALFTPNPRRQQNAARDQQLRQSYPRPDFQKRNVVLITVDSWRPDHLSVYGYERQTTPFLAKLQAAGRLYKVEEARATCNATYCAVTSILSARNFPDLGAGLFKLQDVLKDQGYQVHFLLSGIHTAWYNLRQLYGDSVDTFFDGTLSRHYGANDDRGVLERLATVEASNGQPTFFYFHLMSPHLVGTRLPEYSEWQPVTFQMRLMNEMTVNQNTYDSGVRMADAMIEQIFATLEAKGYLRDALIVILGDHGEAMGEHQFWSHGQALYEEDLRVPFLIVDAPGVTYRNLSSALQLDVAPTIVDRLGLPIPASWQGKSLLQDASHATSYHQAAFQYKRAVLYREGSNVWKYMRNPNEPTEELYELRRDPRETQNLLAAPEAAPLLPRLRELMEAQ